MYLISRLLNRQPPEIFTCGVTVATARIVLPVFSCERYPVFVEVVVVSGTSLTGVNMLKVGGGVVPLGYPHVCVVIAFAPGIRKSQKLNVSESKSHRLIS